MLFHYAKKHFLDTNNIVYHSTSLSRVQTTPKTSTNISQYYLYSRRPGLTGFLQTSHMAENASFSEIVGLNKTEVLE